MTVNVKIRQEVSQDQSFIYTALPRPRKSRLTWGGKRQTSTVQVNTKQFSAGGLPALTASEASVHFPKLAEDFGGHAEGIQGDVVELPQMVPQGLGIGKTAFRALQMGAEQRSR